MILVHASMYAVSTCITFTDGIITSWHSHMACDGQSALPVNQHTRVFYISTCHRQLVMPMLDSGVKTA